LLLHLPTQRQEGETEMISVKQIYAGFFGIIFILALLITVSTSWFIVDQTEQAFLVTLGKPDPTPIEAGLHFKMPWPIQNVMKASRERFSITLGYEARGGNVIVNEQEAKMVTGDENIILVDMAIQWYISDPVSFYFNNDNPVSILRNATAASLRGVIGSSRVDDALTDGRAEIMSRVRDYLVTLVNNYQLGITIESVILQDVDLPNDDVSAAFRKVTDAREERNTKINRARRYENEIINNALGEREAIISRAEGRKIERVEIARGDVAKFNAIYTEYIVNPEITRSRLLLETLEAVLPKTSIYIMDEGSDTVKYLPLQTLRGGQ